jgi:microcystin-dependent protein
VATVTSYTAARMKAIEDGTVVDGDVVGDNLILTKHDGSQVNAGNVRGPVGATGPKGDPGTPAAGAISSIPGEMKLWPGTSLPDVAKYGHWVWADGAVYLVATYPDAAAAIGAQWKTFAGASDPGPGNFRVPDLRGLVPAGMDAMPGGARANRMTRAAAATLAAKVGEEVHTLAESEMPTHDHSPLYLSQFYEGRAYTARPDLAEQAGYVTGANSWTGLGGANILGSSTPSRGGGSSHENVQPSVFVPYIVFLGP